MKQETRSLLNDKHTTVASILCLFFKYIHVQKPGGKNGHMSQVVTTPRARQTGFIHQFVIRDPFIQ